MIGNCRSLPDDFPILVTKLTNLKLLQLRKCQGRWEEFALKTFEAISSLQNLKILELIHIEVNHTVGECLEKCNNIRGLLIIPVFESSVSIKFLFFFF